MFRILSHNLVNPARLNTIAEIRYLSTISARAATPSTPKPNEQGKFWKVTLKRSPIGLHPRTRETARALGLERRGHVVYRQISSELAGMILKLKEIVKVELVDKVEPLKTKATDGFKVIGRMNPQIAPGSKAAKPLLPLRQKN
ncbi:39S ribosomal protein L33, mitochondrial [Coemansia sp. RSA 1813]|nr:39S ribosomal protein L33, mitochondrial [Coemansia sp. RSA 1646]KAJ2092926.1 39S ribosomal protein L33, mitochondrial [Coemansia sp. RSA 986]KAJ2216247.1 39S ribosomal protein L33, mitochondrial [Coemansia sp. RSA 487]KAJ2570580.1 39S ribosomal protein L33, mitochondrial [Coemansia sp. RSA 1813]